MASAFVSTLTDTVAVLPLLTPMDGTWALSFILFKVCSDDHKKWNRKCVKKYRVNSVV
jgi:hypothetical protein